MGEQENIESLSLEVDQSFEVFINLVRQKVEALVDAGTETLMLVDLYGGTPSNTVAATTRDKPIFALTGANLPILLEALAIRDSMPIQELIEHLNKVGKESIKILNEPN